jgi:cyclase
MLNTDVKLILQSITQTYPGSENLVKGYRVRIPSITFSEKMNLYLGKHTIRLIHLPGHTFSQIAVYLPEEKVVFTGDNVTYKTQGFLHEIEPTSWLESLKKIGELDVHYIVPGHGEVCDKSYLKVQSDFIEASVKIIKDAIKKGWDRQAAIKNIKSFPSRYPFDAHAKEIAPMLTRMAVSRMYDLFSK